MGNTIEIILLMEDTPDTPISLFIHLYTAISRKSRALSLFTMLQKLQYTHYVNINMKDSIVSSWLHVSSFLFRDYFLELLLLCFVILDVHCKSQLFKELPKFGLDQSFEDQRNWGFNRITLSLQPNVVDRLYLKLWIQFDQII